MGYFRFLFHRPDFFSPCTLPYKFKKIFFLNKNFTVIVSNMRVLGKKLQGGTKPPSPACLGLTINTFWIHIDKIPLFKIINTIKNLKIFKYSIKYRKSPDLKDLHIKELGLTQAKIFKSLFLCKPIV